MQLLQDRLLTAFLLSIPLSAADIHKREIDIRMFAGVFAAGVLRGFFFKGTAGILPFSLIPGVFLYALSVLSREQIGKGDALYYLCLSPILYFREQAAQLLISWFFAGIFSLFIIITGKKKPVPYIPFAAAAILLAEVWRL